MSIELITGYAGSGHISSADAGRFNAGVCGVQRYVLKTGSKFASSIESGNTIRIADGDAVDQGRHINIPQNSYEEVSVQNGTQGKTRIDVIALRYSKNAGTGVESASVVVIKGTDVATGSTPVAPSVTTGNIYNGALVDEMPLYHVLLEGTQISSVTAVFKEIAPLAGVLDSVYPVGSIYMNVNNVSPAALFGGTWQEINGRFLLGRSDAHPAGQTKDGETVTLTVNHLPEHTHTGPSHTHTVPEHGHTASSASAGAHTHTVGRTKEAASGNKKYAAQESSSTRNTGSAGAHTHGITVANKAAFATTAAGTGNTGSTGGGNAVNIMPPYLAVYIWVRTA